MDRYTRDGHGLWLAIEKASGQAVGQVGLTIQQVDGVEEPEVGYLIHRPYWRQGFAAEAAAASRDYALEELRKPRVISLIRPVNIPSLRVALRLGMKPEKLTMRVNLEHLVLSISRAATV
jgi:RimJ/RimL family protein N-acetyltransferase